MPGYGILPADQGGGLLPWSWALERLRASHDFWVATVWPAGDAAGGRWAGENGRPHLMPVWAVWDGDVLWFSSSLGSRKIRNIRAGSAVTVSTADPLNPVIVEGTAEIVTETAAIQRFLDGMNRKYGTDFTIDFLDPAKNASVRVRPRRAFGLKESEFEGSPTRWEFA
jgi:pyridoxamine 5'-phosphate oxidase-like protein